MTETLPARREQAAIIEQVVIKGDLSKLSDPERVSYYLAVCQSAGLNPVTQPFQYLPLSNKLVLYATRACTDQLRANRKLTATIVSRERIDEVYVVTARVTGPDGRSDESIGAVNIGGLKGDMLANALMKAETKAKRRATLSLTGLGLLDETEVETIPGAGAPIQIDLMQEIKREMSQRQWHDNPPEPEPADNILAPDDNSRVLDLIAKIEEMVVAKGFDWTVFQKSFAQNNGHMLADATVEEIEKTASVVNGWKSRK